MKGHVWGVSRRTAGGSRCRALPILGTMPAVLTGGLSDQGTRVLPRTAPILRFGTDLPGHASQTAAQRHFRVAVATFLPGRPKLRPSRPTTLDGRPVDGLARDRRPHRPAGLAGASSRRGPTRDARDVPTRAHAVGRPGARRAARGVRPGRAACGVRRAAATLPPPCPTSGTRPARPLLLVDVDGVISLFGFAPHEQPAGRWAIVDGHPAPALPHRGRAPAPPGRALRPRLVHGLGGEGRRSTPARSGAPAGLPHLAFDRHAGRGMQGHWKLAAIDEHAGPGPRRWPGSTTPSRRALRRLGGGAPGPDAARRHAPARGPHRGPRRAARGLGGRASRGAGGLARRPSAAARSAGRTAGARAWQAGPRARGPAGGSAYWRSPPPSSGTSRSASSSAKPGSVPPAPISSRLARSSSKPAPKPPRPSPSPSPSSAAISSWSSRPDLVDRARQRLGRLDLDPPVALEPRGGRDQLADDHVLLQAVEGVLLALERGVGQDLRRLLEGGRRQERVRVQRGLRDAEDDLLVLRRLALALP